MNPTPKEALGSQLAEYLTQVRQLRDARNGDPRPGDYHGLKEWQAERLMRTYADVLADPRYHAAAEFFLTDLYGAKDFSSRDAQLARVLPIMLRILPEKALATLIEAVRMDTLSESLDTDMVLAMRRLGIDCRRIDGETYAAAYRACDRTSDRELQIALIDEIGQALDRLTHLPMIQVSLRLMRKPAALAGLEDLHRFLEQGFQAFRSMAGAHEFLAIINQRETCLMRELLAGKTAPRTMSASCRPFARQGNNC
jgi:hypothetical protein